MTQSSKASTASYEVIWGKRRDVGFLKVAGSKAFVYKSDKRRAEEFCRKTEEKMLVRNNN